jgi:uroporphyrinogen-III decarboxylase
MLRTLNRKEVDHLPCCFMSFSALRQRVGEDRFELCKAERQMGLDSAVFIPTASRSERPEHPDLRGLPVRFHPDVSTREWRDVVKGDFDFLHKEYITPAGTLSTSVRLSGDWPHSDHIPFVDDYQIPRALKPLITEPEELNALQFMLMPPSEEDRERFRKEAEAAKALAQQHSLILCGGWGIGMDMLNWLCGMQQLMVLTLDNPGFVGDLLEMVRKWNESRMEVVLSAPIDLFLRRAWYEGCDFIVPEFFRHEVLPKLKGEVELVHAQDAKFGYICSTGTKAMLDYYAEAGFDVLIGIDPVQGRQTDLRAIKNGIGDRISLWGGVSGAVTVERGTEKEVREAAREAIDALGPNGFILSPVDNITLDEPQTWRNIAIFIDEWRKHW